MKQKFLKDFLSLLKINLVRAICIHIDSRKGLRYILLILYLEALFIFLKVGHFCFYLINISLSEIKTWLIRFIIFD